MGKKIAAIAELAFIPGLMIKDKNIRATPVRAPKRYRPLRRERADPLEHDLEKMADQVSYIGSPEHKETPSFAGHPAPRADATLCPPELGRQKEVVETWLKTAIRAGCFSKTFTGRFPRYVWHRVDNQYFEARLTNETAGAYKGYPINAEEYPR